MTALSTLEAYDLLRHCATLAERIARAEVDQLSRAGLDDEKIWLHQALERVEPLLPVIEAMLARCRELPELAPAREDHAQVVQGAWVDALERLVGGLTLHVGSRAPILETLFPHLKFPALRRGSPEVVRGYAADLERRSRLGYVKRILSGPDFAFAEPLVLAVFERFKEWESCFEPGSLTEEEAAPLREELAALTATAERHMRQARLLAEASLCPVEGAFEASGIGSRPRRRVGTVEVEPPPGLDPEPEDDGVSLVEALGWGTGSGAADASPAHVLRDAADTQAVAEEDEAAAPDAGAGPSHGRGGHSKKGGRKARAARGQEVPPPADGPASPPPEASDATGEEEPPTAAPQGSPSGSPEDTAPPPVAPKRRRAHSRATTAVAPADD